MRNVCFPILSMVPAAPLLLEDFTFPLLSSQPSQDIGKVHFAYFALRQFCPTVPRNCGNVFTGKFFLSGRLLLGKGRYISSLSLLTTSASSQLLSENYFNFVCGTLCHGIAQIWLFGWSFKEEKMVHTILLQKLNLSSLQM